MKTVPESTKTWLLESEIPYVRFNAGLLFHPGEEQPRALLQGDPFVRANIARLSGWEAEILRRHNQPDLLIHTLALLADLGVRADDPGMASVVDTILSSVGEDGIPRLTIEIPKAFGGSGNPERAWIICDFPVVLYGLLRMGVRNGLIDRSVTALEGLVGEGGCLCLGSFPTFRGPGSKTSICPYANLLAARALAGHETAAGGEAASRAVGALLRHWEERAEKKYFMFGIGTDFRKLKFPNVWYGLLQVLDAVTAYERFRGDPRVLEMTDLLESKAGPELRFTPESMYRVFADADFSNKKAPSPTLTLFCLRILERMGRVGF